MSHGQREQAFATRRTVPPTVLPVLVQEVKEYLGIYDDELINDRIEFAIQCAVDQVERDSRRCLMPQTWQMTMDEFPCHNGVIQLRKVPVISVTSVKYIIDNVLTTMSPALYTTDLVSEPARITPVYGMYWPVTDCRMNAVTIEWVSGYSTPEVLAASHAVARGAVLYAAAQQFRGCETGPAYRAMIERMQTFGMLS